MALLLPVTSMFMQPVLVRRGFSTCGLTRWRPLVGGAALKSTAAAPVAAASGGEWRSLNISVSNECLQHEHKQASHVCAYKNVPWVFQGKT